MQSPHQDEQPGLCEEPDSGQARQEGAGEPQLHTLHVKYERGQRVVDVRLQLVSGDSERA